MRKKRLRAVEMGGRLFIGRDSNVGAGDRPHATVNAHKTRCALGAVARPNVILFYFLNFFIRVGAVFFYSRWGGRPPPRDMKCAQISVRSGGGCPPQRDFILFFKFFYSRWGGRPPPSDIAVGAGDRPNVILFF